MIVTLWLSMLQKNNHEVARMPLLTYNTHID
jgi:hypothetical protein